MLAIVGFGGGLTASADSGEDEESDEPHLGTDSRGAEVQR